MTETREAEGESSDAPKPRSPLIVGWKPEDAKLLIMTITGAVIANVITLVIVALAIVIARYYVRPQAKGLLGYFVFLIVPAIFIPTAFGVLIQHWRQSRHTKGMVIFFGFFTLVYILAIIGFAAGVK